MSTGLLLLVVCAAAVTTFSLTIVLRRAFPQIDGRDVNHWAPTLSYVATSYGVVIGFAILLLFGTYTDARSAVGDEATAIGTAFEEVHLFPEDEEPIRRALICYGRAVPLFDWPAMQNREASPEVSDAYRDVIEALGAADTPPAGTFGPAAATNVFLQVGNMSTAREVRLVTAETSVPPLLWILIIAGGFLVVGLLFALTLRSAALPQALLLTLATMFTVVMISIIVQLSQPFSPSGRGITPRLIEETTASMVAEDPDAAGPCPFETTDA